MEVFDILMEVRNLLTSYLNNVQHVDTLLEATRDLSAIEVRLRHQAVTTSLSRAVNYQAKIRHVCCCVFAVHTFVPAKRASSLARCFRKTRLFTCSLFPQNALGNDFVSSLLVREVGVDTNELLTSLRAFQSLDMDTVNSITTLLDLLNDTSSCIKGSERRLKPHASWDDMKGDVGERAIRYELMAGACM